MAEEDIITLSSDEEWEQWDDKEDDELVQLAILNSLKESSQNPSEGQSEAGPSSKSAEPDAVTLDDEDDEIEVMFEKGKNEVNHCAATQVIGADDIQTFDSVSGEPSDENVGLGNEDEVAGAQKDEREADDEETYRQRSEDAITAFCEKFKVCRPAGTTLKEMKRAEDMMWGEYRKVKDKMPKSFHIRLQEEVQAGIQTLGTSSSQAWPTVQRLLGVIKSDLHHDVTAKVSKVAKLLLSEEKKKGDENSKEKLIEIAEKRFKMLELKIFKLENEEVDLDDEQSSYLKLDTLRARLAEAYFELCDIKNGDKNRFTGRSVQKCLKLKKHKISSGHDEIDRAIEDLAKKEGMFFAPDYQDILTIVKEVNEKCGLKLTDEKESKIAKTTCYDVVMLVKKRRGKDFAPSMLYHLPKSELNDDVLLTNRHFENNTIQRLSELDPAEKDPELLAKLKENDASKNPGQEGEFRMHLAQVGVKGAEKIDSDDSEEDDYYSVEDFYELTDDEDEEFQEPCYDLLSGGDAMEVNEDFEANDRSDDQSEKRKSDGVEIEAISTNTDTSEPPSKKKKPDANSQ